MITDQDRCFLRDSDEQFVFQHVDGSWYIQNEHEDFENCGLQWDDDEEVYFITNDENFENFLDSLGFDSYDPFVG